MVSPKKENQFKKMKRRVVTDLHHAVINVGKAVALHTPKLIVGEGQGALVASAFANPQVLEEAFFTRNKDLNKFRTFD